MCWQVERAPRLAAVATIHDLAAFTVPDALAPERPDVRELTDGPRDDADLLWRFLMASVSESLRLGHGGAVLVLRAECVVTNAPEDAHGWPLWHDCASCRDGKAVAARVCEHGGVGGLGQPHSVRMRRRNGTRAIGARIGCALSVCHCLCHCLSGQAGTGVDKGT